jgi:hypothetical protein
VAHHLIFIESPTEVGANTDREQVFRQMGLEDHTSGCDALPLSAEESPSGNPGILYAWRSKGDDQMIVRKDKQTWMKSVSGYWVGVWNDNLPTEAQLRRPYTQHGEWVEFGDRRETWKLPTPATIDQRIALSDDGSWVYRPIRELSWYSDEVSKRRSGCEIGEQHESGDLTINVSYDMFDVTSLIVRALRINYRLTPEVCHLLDMFSARNVTFAYGRMMGLDFKE